MYNQDQNEDAAVTSVSSKTSCLFVCACVRWSMDGGELGVARVGSVVLMGWVSLCCCCFFCFVFVLLFYSNVKLWWWWLMVYSLRTREGKRRMVSMSLSDLTMRKVGNSVYLQSNNVPQATAQHRSNKTRPRRRKRNGGGGTKRWITVMVRMAMEKKMGQTVRGSLRRKGRLHSWQ